MISKYISIIATAVVATACSTVNSPTKYEATAFDKKNTGVAVIKMSEYAPETLNKTNISVSFRIKNIQTNNQYTISGTNGFMPGIYNPQTFDDNVFILEPGIYYVDYIYLPGKGNYIRWFPGPGIKKTSKKKEIYIVRTLAFEIRAGMAYNFGDIRIVSTQPMKFKTEINTQTVKEDMIKAKHQDLANNLVDQPIIAAGSIIDLSSGAPKITSAEQIEESISELFEEALERRNKKNKLPPKK